jgi:hypothetical protein
MPTITWANTRFLTLTKPWPALWTAIGANVAEKVAELLTT